MNLTICVRKTRLYVHVDPMLEKVHHQSLQNFCKIYPGCVTTLRVAVVKSKKKLKNLKNIKEIVFTDKFFARISLVKKNCYSWTSNIIWLPVLFIRTWLKSMLTMFRTTSSTQLPSKSFWNGIVNIILTLNTQRWHGVSTKSPLRTEMFFSNLLTLTIAPFTLGPTFSDL